MTTQMASMSMGGPRSPGQQQPGYGDLPPPPPELMDQNYSQQHAQPGMYNNILEDFNCLFLNDRKEAFFTESYALLICESIPRGRCGLQLLLFELRKWANEVLAFTEQ